MKGMKVFLFWLILGSCMAPSYGDARYPSYGRFLRSQFGLLNHEPESISYTKFDDSEEEKPHVDKCIENPNSLVVGYSCISGPK
jgi:hypothetical protein